MDKQRAHLAMLTRATPLMFVRAALQTWSASVRLADAPLKGTRFDQDISIESRPGSSNFFRLDRGVEVFYLTIKSDSTGQLPSKRVTVRATNYERL